MLFLAYILTFVEADKKICFENLILLLLFILKLSLLQAYSNIILKNLILNCILSLLHHLFKILSSRSNICLNATDQFLLYFVTILSHDKETELNITL